MPSRPLAYVKSPRHMPFRGLAKDGRTCNRHNHLSNGFQWFQRYSFCRGLVRTGEIGVTGYLILTEYQVHLVADPRPGNPVCEGAVRIIAEGSALVLHGAISDNLIGYRWTYSAQTLTGLDLSSVSAFRPL
jgi:hypothetical protein